MPPTLYMGVYKAIAKKNNIWVVEQVSVTLIMFIVIAAVLHVWGVSEYIFFVIYLTLT